MRPRLIKTGKFRGCWDRNWWRLDKSCRDRDFDESLAILWYISSLASLMHMMWKMIPQWKHFLKREQILHMIVRVILDPNSNLKTFRALYCKRGENQDSFLDSRSIDSNENMMPSFARRALVQWNKIYFSSPYHIMELLGKILEQ